MDSIDFELSAKTVLLRLKVLPGAPKNSFRGIHAGQLKVGVTATAQQGKANQAIIDFLARKLKLPKQQLTIVAGLTSTRKKIAIEGITLDQLKTRMQTLLEQE